MSHFLVVEDDPKTLEAMSDLLLALGHEVSVAEDGEVAVTAALEKLPDVILLDFSLPKQHGWAVANQLRQHESTQKIPIVAITAHVMVATQETALEVGCDAYLTKPLELATFEPWLNKFLQERNLQ